MYIITFTGSLILLIERELTEGLKLYELDLKVDSITKGLFWQLN